MRFDTGSVNVGTAGTRVQVSALDERVVWIRFSWRSGNSTAVYVGRDDVSASNGYELSTSNRTLELDFAKPVFGKPAGTVTFSDFYVDVATNNDDIDWAVILA